MLSILERFTDEPTQTVHQRNATGMLAALGDTGRHVYMGTVPAATVATRRRRNRAARRARRAARR